jgi:hypothetical protein
VAAQALDAELAEEEDAKVWRCRGGGRYRGWDTRSNFFCRLSLCLLRLLDIRGKLDTNVLADGTPIFAPISVPVRSMTGSLSTFTTALLATASELLAIGNFIIHESAPIRSSVGKYKENRENLLSTFLLTLT